MAVFLKLTQRDARMCITVAEQEFSKRSPVLDAWQRERLGLAKTALHLGKSNTAPRKSQITNSPSQIVNRQSKIGNSPAGPPTAV